MARYLSSTHCKLPCFLIVTILLLARRCVMVVLPIGTPARGMYFKQTLHRVPGKSKLPWYLTPPSQASDGFQNKAHDGLDAGVVFGPVHAFEETWNSKGFVSILVPPPWSKLRNTTQHLPSLVWINVYKRHWDLHARAVRWAEPVHESVVEDWVKRGWQHNFYD